MRRQTPTMLALACAGVLASCVTVNATPDRPIDINLNVNIRQEIVVSLRDDARELIRDNPDLF